MFNDKNIGLLNFLIAIPIQILTFYIISQYKSKSPTIIIYVFAFISTVALTFELMRSREFSSSFLYVFSFLNISVLMYLIVYFLHVKKNLFYKSFLVFLSLVPMVIALLSIKSESNYFDESISQISTVFSLLAFFTTNVHISKSLKYLNTNTPEGNNSDNSKAENEFIRISVSKEQRVIFADLLRTFENYAQLKGYKVYVSLDMSLADSIGFKFNIDELSSHINQQIIRADFKEFIDKIKAGDTFENMPYITSPAEHELVSTILRTKLISLKHELEIKQLKIECVEKMLEMSKSISVKQIYNITESSVNIESTFSKDEALQLIEKFLVCLKDEKDIKKSIRSDIKESFYELKEELNKPEINHSKIALYLLNVKSIAEKVVFSHHCEQAFGSIYHFFKSFLP